MMKMKMYSSGYPIFDEYIKQSFKTTVKDICIDEVNNEIVDSSVEEADVVLVMGSRQDIELINNIIEKKKLNDFQLVIVDTSSYGQLLRDSKLKYIDGYWGKMMSSENFEFAISQLIKGERYYESNILKKITYCDEVDVKKILTKRQLEIVDQIIEGKNTKEIANKLWVSQGTVKTHVNRIFNKLGVHSREELRNKYSDVCIKEGVLA